ncbi:unnamed protein product [Euphydryas editha]|uniref:Uncharacterized protein n=1 Tax=Euphydryas editha TaxID=104508 RepID=A0AAU9V2F0_EUPED|nr:unnamed protein product [Euphydryas editha]
MWDKNTGSKPVLAVTLGLRLEDTVNVRVVFVSPTEADNGLVDRQNDQRIVLQDHTNFAIFPFTLHRLKGDRSEEHRKAGTGHRHLTHSSAGRKGANVWRSTRFGADCRSAGSFPAARGDTTTTICQPSVPAPRLAHRNGGWRLKHAPLPLPYCYVMGTRPRTVKALR